MPEWLNGPHSKCGIPQKGIGGSNPSPAARLEILQANMGLFFIVLDFREFCGQRNLWFVLLSLLTVRRASPRRSACRQSRAERIYRGKPMGGTSCRQPIRWSKIGKSNSGARDGNRTRVPCLEGRCTATVLLSLLSFVFYLLELHALI